MCYGYVYVLECQVNGKKYVGQTKQTPSKRLYNHRSRSKTDFRGCQKLYRAMRKYGTHTFSLVQSIPVQSREELDNLEIELIKSLGTQKNGYNIDNGGKGREAVTEATKQKLRKITKARWQNDVYREQVTKSIKETFAKPEVKEQNSLKMKEIWKRPEYQELQKSNNITTEQKREKCKNKQKKLWAENTSYREKMTKVSNDLWEDPLKRKAFGESVSKRWKSAEYRQKKNLELHQGKTIVAVFPNGTEQVVEWLADFCRNQCLDLRAANKVLKGKKNFNTVKGFRFLYRNLEGCS